MSRLGAELSAGQPALQSATKAEDAAAAAFMRCTPALLKEASALQRCLKRGIECAEGLRAELPHMHAVISDLRLMSAQVYDLRMRVISHAVLPDCQPMQEPLICFAQ